MRTPASIVSSPSGKRLGATLAGVSALAALLWLTSKLWLGIDFTDEMQYYGQMAGLVRTGRLFQNDLFIQQVGYLLLLPFLELHHWLFPDQSYLLLFGRSLLFSGYLIVGVLFWRTRCEHPGPSTCARVAGLAVYLSWIPFQLFAPSYNTMSYLLMVAIVSISSPDILRSSRGRRAGLAALLAALVLVHPTLGLAFVALNAAEFLRRRSIAAAAEVLGIGVLLCAVVLIPYAIHHGPTFLDDLTTSFAFSRSFNVGAAILAPRQFLSLLCLGLATGILHARARRGQAMSLSAFPALVWALLVSCAVTTIVLTHLAISTNLGFLALTPLFPALALLRVTVASPKNRNRNLLEQATSTTLLLCCATLVITALSAAPPFLMTALFFCLQLLPLATPDQSQNPSGEPLLLPGAILGAVCAITSSNGLLNFGVGAGFTVPFLILRFEKRFADAETVLPLFRLLFPPVSACLILAHGALHPYRESPHLTEFRPIQGVPAFKALWTSPVKIEAAAKLGVLAANSPQRRQNVLVVGPLPWLYFAGGSVPNTPMFFMHFTGKPGAWELVARDLASRPAPDVIIIAADTIPTELHAPLETIIQSTSYSVANLDIAQDLSCRYWQATSYRLPRRLVVLSRRSIPTSRPIVP